MKQGIALFIFAFAGAFFLKAQCNGCPAIGGILVDFCFQEPEIPGRCAQFSQDSPTFYFQDCSRKKPLSMELPLPESLAMPTTGYLLGLGADNSMKLSAADLLLIAHGVELWRQMEGIRQWDPAVVESGYTLRPSGLALKPLLVGGGKLPQPGNRLSVHYTGYLESGKKFDSSLDRKQSFQFTLGASQVITGWEEGLAAMTVGSRYLLRVPPHLGYGETGAGHGAIPPNATLYFDVQLLSAE